MSDPKIPAVVVDSEITPPLKERLLSLDIFRGMTLIAMTMVDMPGAEGFTYAAITHARWNGWSIADLIFPFFIFIVGVAMPYSYAKRLARGDSRGKLVAHILLRTVILFAIGVFMNVYFNYMDGLTRYHLYNFRIFNALQRIALCYFFASILYLRLKNRGLAITATAILVLYFILLKFVPVPGHGVGVLGIDGNWVQFIDLHVIAGHMGLGESTSWEPKGLLSTFPALANMLIGVLAGVYLRSPRRWKKSAPFSWWGRWDSFWVWFGVCGSPLTRTYGPAPSWFSCVEWLWSSWGAATMWRTSGKLPGGRSPLSSLGSILFSSG